MGDIRREASLPILFEDDVVLGMLGYAERPVPQRVRDIVAEMRAEAAPLLKPACAILRAGPELLARSLFLKELDGAVLCLVTIGVGVEQAMERYDAAGEIAKALIMNVFGSAAVEAAADAANDLIRGDIAREGLRCTRRFSPGYGGWALSEQRWILPALGGESLGVALTEGCMMVPRKSITFAVSVGEHPMEMRSDNACDGCELINCEYRRKTVTREVNGKQWVTFIGPESNYCPRNRWH
ncbi:MAG: hypothetical protein OEX18_02595 [Candidatus Krumholzibacteria bacterium]|nr:hypothetical protein [Candidatus Krumholzibacteria bacterium]MDH4336148.1 hypothetical protein [Candidatus Krumholzibacteria bacterium]MDH5268789.1 hypothetical protein [Candidatus Krumholzibacteria bacterium]